MAYAFGPGDQELHHRHGGSEDVNGYGHGGLQASSGLPHLNYPPPHNHSNPSYIGSQVDLNSRKAEDVQIYTTRTPSPTPSEHAMLNRKGVLDWKKLVKWRFWIRREWLWYYVILAILLVLVILISVYDKQIVSWLQPTAEKIKDLPFGWIIPIAIFFVISFPPLFGHEILAILCGVVWGLGVGFAITAAGTFLGEMGNFYAFKYCCRARGEKLEKKDLQYACLAQMVRQGGFWIALVARYSAIPGHFTTAVFSTCGMGVFIFALAAFLSLPKQFVTVYIGVILKESGEGTESKKDKLISDGVLAVSIIITGVAMWYIYKKMDEVKGDVIYQRRKARQGKLERARSVGSSVFNPAESDSDLPLTLNPGEDTAFQQWDSHGRASGYAGDPRLSNTMHAPTPQRATSANIERIPTYRTDGGGGYSTSGDRYASPSGGRGQLSTPTSRTMSPIHAQPQRQESVDSWNPAGQGPGADSYRLPTIQPHTPLSGGFTNVPVSANNPFARDALQQQQIHQAQHTGSSASAVLPPLAPPPTTLGSSNPHSPHSPTSPTVHAVHSISPTSTGYTQPQYAAPAMSSPYEATITSSPTSQQYPANAYSSPQAVPRSPTQVPSQYNYAFQPQNQPRVPAQPYPSTYTPPQNIFAYSSPVVTVLRNPSTYNQVGTTTHAQESSGETEYYTPDHSRAPTEQHPEDRLSTPTQAPPEYRP